MCRSFLGGFLVLFNKADKCCQLPYSLVSGSSADLAMRHEVTSLRMGWDGTEDQKCLFTFFILKYIKQYPQIY